MSRKWRRSILWVAVGLVTGLGGGLAYLSLRSGPTLTAERLADARELWKATGPSSYVLELEMRGRLNERRRVEVKDRVAVDLLAAGATANRSSWDHWTVEGLFAALEREIANARRPQQTYGIEDPKRVQLSAEFDPEHGYPTYFRRHLEGFARDIQWRVIAFETP
jgi:hypothetical protein